MIRFSLLLCVFCSFFVVSCGTDEEGIERPDVSDIQVDVNIQRLEQELFAASSKEDIQQFINQHPSVADFFLGRQQFPQDSMLVNRLYKLINDPSLDTVFQESQKIFPDLQAVEKQYETAFRYIKYYYPEFRTPRVVSMITGFGSDLYVSDSLIIIGLDYYLGDEASFRPVHLPDYIQKRFQPETIAPTSLLLLSNRFNETEMSDRTLLAEMIYFGKAYYFVDFVLPSLADSTMFGYTAEEVAGLNVNRRRVWSHFIENQLLYETRSAVKTKYLDERPKTLEVADEAPGRVATWVGYEIVKAYMKENEGIDLRGLMENKQVRQIFEQANYRPQ